MKYLGDEKQVQIITSRGIEYIRCDRCGDKIIPSEYKDHKSQYIHIHTCHNDWGNDSIESNEYNDYCVKCAKEVTLEYIENMSGSETLELTNEYLSRISTYRGEVSPSDGCDLVINDKYNKD